MAESGPRVIEFLEKEIKTYLALSLFLSKKTPQEHMQMGENTVLMTPRYYQQRIQEALSLVYELRRAN